MRIKSIQLDWFRGAADCVVLDPGEKSVVVYGENGAGKSSFVDAIEYLICDGKIGHLALEQSGKRQEKAIPNTHCPDDKKTSFKVEFKDGSSVGVQIGRDGASKKTGKSGSGIEAWDYQRTVLRQDEVATFIKNTKGEKYSALLPLLGLAHLEIAAENLRKLSRAIETESKLAELKGALQDVHARRMTTFGSQNDEQIVIEIKDLRKKYCPDEDLSEEVISLCKQALAAVDERVARASSDQRQHLILKDLAETKVDQHIISIRDASAKLAESVEPFIDEKLQVLEAASAFANTLAEEEKINCPACGQEISRENFKSHVAEERARLQEVTETFNERRRAIGLLCDEISKIRPSLAKADIKSWRESLKEQKLVNGVKFLSEIDLNDLRSSCSDSDLEKIKNSLSPVVAAAAAACEKAPPDIQELTGDKRNLDVALAIFEARPKAEAIVKIGVLKNFVGKLEDGVRDEISKQSQEIVESISVDIQSMWGIIHPREHIEDVRLHVPEDVDKAIDICLKFHGIEQDSPRLTLSEGFRNSLGLCIFLAMAKREDASDKPNFLDDVVVSVDRNHRGMIVDLFEKVFGERQLIVFTHDRDWFIELKQRLEGWSFKALMPYETPLVGIRWSAKTYGFDDARKFLNSDPDTAGNTARKIMDIELALLAERLQTRLPYLHREKNDHRVAHEFLRQIIADGEKCFQKKKNGAAGAKSEYEASSEALEALKEADKLLVAWGNKGSHTFDVAKSEAAKLIDACEKALNLFICSDCSKAVHRLDDEKSELLQCGCGAIRWRYGKS